MLKQKLRLTAALNRDDDLQRQRLGFGDRVDAVLLVEQQHRRLISLELVASQIERAYAEHLQAPCRAIGVGSGHAE